MPRVSTGVFVPLLFLGALGFGSLHAQAPTRHEVAESFARRGAEEARAARDAAERRGWVRRGTTPDGRTFQLVRLRDGLPIYYETLAANAGISSAANLIRSTPPYSVEGAGWTIGVWDAGAVRADHVELEGRVTHGDGADLSGHATFVAGIAASEGVNPDAIGAAPAAGVLSHDWEDDLAEIASAAAATAFDEAPAVFVANLSYGEAVGWQHGSYSGETGPHFIGDWPEGNPPPKSDRFGRYTIAARDWDLLAHALSYTLIVKAAGNDRNDPPPSPGQTFHRLAWDDDEYEWVAETYDPDIHPPGDGATDGGYDTIPSFSTAKNLLVVGSVTDAVTAGVRDVSAASINAFSVWGPTDDGRIKPDLMANGATIVSATAGSTTSYASGASGTSFAAPGVSGVAVLLQELHGRETNAGAMRASTLKGLLIHTADDLTTFPAQPGPDYATGWGLINAARAADLILDAAAGDKDAAIVEDELNAIAPLIEYTFESAGTEEVRVTLSWTDPPGEPLVGIDNRTPALVNDLDLRVVAPDSTVHFPFVLGVENPSAAATTGDNLVDPVEQVRIDAPEPGTYIVQVDHKGALQDEVQAFSLIVSGLSVPEATAVRDWMLFDE